MKLSDIEKGHLKILLNNGYKYVARDECGIYAFKQKPVLHISKARDYSLRFWKQQKIQDAPVVFLNNEEFLLVGFEPYPYKITPKANLVYDRPRTKKAVAV